MTIENNKIIASEGKVFKRISDNVIFGQEINLGYTYYINGELLKEPKLEVPEDFEEIDDPNIVSGDSINLEGIIDLG